MFPWRSRTSSLNSAWRPAILRILTETKARELETDTWNEAKTLHTSPVLTQHEDSQGQQPLQAAHLVDQVVIEIQEHQPAEVGEVLQPRDGVVLEVEQSETLFSLQDGADDEVPPIQVQPIGVHSTLLWGSVDHGNPGGHRRLRKDHMILRGGGVGSGV